MKIAVLYICTGKYIRFWDEFYRTAETCLLPGLEKHYFVFTDATFPEETSENVTKVAQQNLGWPDNTLRRFHMFLQVENVLANFDYVYYFNANCRFQQTIEATFLPENDDALLVVQHPGQIAKPTDKLPYERNPRSRACIPIGTGRYYVCGGVNGGSAKTFLRFARAARTAIDDDFRNGVVAIWHDESHLNRYILDHPHTVRHAGYCYPQGNNLDVLMMIECRDKKGYGGHDYLRAISSAGNTENMVTVALYGGLGNQMFQYAAGRALAHRQGCRLQLDTRHYNHFQAFPYGLGDFAIDATIGTARTLPPPKSDKLKYFIWRHLSRRPRMVRERGLGYHPDVGNEVGTVYLHGYWQSEKYFADCRDQIRRDLQIVTPPSSRNAETLDEIGSTRSVAVHIRRGDYVSDSKTNAFHGTCTIQYYQSAVREIARLTSIEPTVFLFSDDLDWATRNLDFGLSTVPVGNNDRDTAFEDLRLMSACDHQVISNSTFSWWAAWLNPSPNKIVIAPDHWLADRKADSRDIVPRDWIRWHSHTAGPLPRAA